MKKRLQSDIPSKFSGKVIILRPLIKFSGRIPRRTPTGHPEKELFLGSSSRFFGKVINQVTDLDDLSHVGTLTFTGSDASNLPDYVPCEGAGHVRFKSKSPSGYPGSKSGQRANLVMVCPGCSVLGGTIESRQELGGKMLYLMLKQMLPALPFCNYINCYDTDLEPSCHADRKVRLDSITQLGVVSVLPNIFWDENNNPVGLGFILQFLMTTGVPKDVFDGYSDWLSTLILERERRLGSIIKSFEGSLRGPKTV